MYFKQFYLGCLAHASYLIGADGEAAVVDPQRDVDQYIEEAAAQHLQIKYIIETHLHADFVSGHRELSGKTGAEIVFGKEAGATFPHRAVKDGDELTIGRVKLRFMETPGHTPESICVLLFDTESPDAAQKLLTGDTLFIGDVGRPDLAGGRGYTSQDMAAMMYDSLHKKILTLRDDVEVYPAHGAGSMCGKNISTDTSSTIGQQRKFNYALQPMSKDDFVRMMTTDLPEAPAYFPQDAEINRGGAASLEGLPPLRSMTPAEVAECAKHGCIVLDVRTSDEFGAGHVPGSMNIGLSGQFASWAGTLIPMTAPIVLLAESEDKAEEARMRLARVGLENIKGHLGGGMDAWKAVGFEMAIVPQLSVAELKGLIDARADLQVLDVRRPAEYESGHVPRAVTSPLSKLREALPLLAFDPAKTTTVICAGGYRSSAAASLLQAAGFSDLLNVTGGTTAWIKAGYDVEQSVPPASAGGS